MGSARALLLRWSMCTFLFRATRGETSDGTLFVRQPTGTYQRQALRERFPSETSRRYEQAAAPTRSLKQNPRGDAPSRYVRAFWGAFPRRRRDPSRRYAALAPDSISGLVGASARLRPSCLGRAPARGGRARYGRSMCQRAKRPGPALQRGLLVTDRSRSFSCSPLGGVDESGPDEAEQPVNSSWACRTVPDHEAEPQGGV